MQNLTYLSEEHLAKDSLKREQEKDWVTNVLSWPLSIAESLMFIGLNGLFGKTSRERLLLMGGGDLKLFFRKITEIGYGLSWRILDARYFGSAQRRRRVFAVGYFGDWRPSAAVLFERPSLSGDFKKGRKIADSPSAGIEKDTDTASVYDWHRQTGEMRPQIETCCTATANWGTGGNNMPLVKTYATESYSKISASDTGATLKASGGMYGGGSENYVTAINLERNFKDGFSGIGGDKSYTLTSKHTHGVVDGFIRKLTPIECERLQNFPDNWTDIPYRGKEHAPHSLRYKALGNSMNVNVMHWIGVRIDFISKIMRDLNHGR